MKKAITVLATCAVLFGGFGTQGSRVAAQTGHTRAHQSTASVSLASLRGKTIGISEPDIIGPFFVNILYGAEKEAQKYGIKLIIEDAGGYSNIDKQISQFETLVSKRVDAIFVDPADFKAFVPVVNRAIAAHIPVFGFGDPVTGAVSSVYGAHYRIGQAIANFLGQTVKQGEIVAEAGPPGAVWTTTRYKGFIATLKKYPGLRLKATQWTNADSTDGLNTTEDFLARFPNLKGIYAADNSIGEGAGNAVAAHHAQDRVAVATAVMSIATRNMIRKGYIKFDVAMQVVMFGRIAIQNAIKYWQHKPVPKDVVPAMINVTKANVNTVNYGTMMAPPGFKP